MMPRSLRTGAGALVATLLLCGPGPGRAHAQVVGGAEPVRITSEPVDLELEVGATGTLEFQAVDAEGNVLAIPLRVVAPRGVLRIEGSHVTALQVGEHRIVASEVLDPDADREPLRHEVTVRVAWPAVDRVEVDDQAGGTHFEGVTARLRARALHADGSERPEPEVTWRTVGPEVASVDAFGNLTAHATGTTTVEAEVDGVTGRSEVTVTAFPGASIEIEGGRDRVRTGDVQALRAIVRDAAGRELDGLPVTWSLTHRAPDELRGPGAPGRIDGGRVVADLPGEHTVIVSVGPLSARTTFLAEPRDAVRSLEVVGQGRQDHVRTTDFWVFEGVDGRDYAIAGAKMSDGQAFVFDVTDPTNIVKTDSIRVDARSINDVKVSPDARFATLTREGASDRRNGVVILDLTDPAHPVVASEVSERLTGGVHNAFPTNEHVFALSGGQGYVILDVRDIHEPRFVSEVRHEDCTIHDVWVHEGIAYSAQWGCGVVAYDVGNGRWGGSPERPVFINAYVVPGGATHAVFPYHQPSTGRLYLFIGDEIMSRRGLAWEGVPGNYQVPYDPATGEGGTILSTRGYIQIVDFTDPDAPEMVARYEVPEYGTHNIWVEDDVLYQAYYEGGLRVVDVSGDLMGNLYTQGREIAVYRSADPVGYVPNSPMVWSAMPFKGLVFFSDTNSGLWAVRLEPDAGPVM